MTRFLPVLMATLSFGAAVVYLFNGDWKHSLYWLAAGVIAIVVTLL